jgi:hypothetical protein
VTSRALPDFAPGQHCVGGLKEDSEWACKFLQRIAERTPEYLIFPPATPQALVRGGECPLVRTNPVEPAPKDHPYDHFAMLGGPPERGQAVVFTNPGSRYVYWCESPWRYRIEQGIFLRVTGKLPTTPDGFFDGTRIADAKSYQVRERQGGREAHSCPSSGRTQRLRGLGGPCSLLGWTHDTDMIRLACWLAWTTCGRLTCDLRRCILLCVRSRCGTRASRPPTSTSPSGPSRPLTTRTSRPSTGRATGPTGTNGRYDNPLGKGIES